LGRRRTLEVLVDPATWGGRRVLVTGHSGFKGGWLSLWLDQLGAKVTGLALEPPTSPSFFEQVRLGELVEDNIVDIRDEAGVRALLETARPEIVFHLAAQPLVRYSYECPVETYATNVMGTVHLLEACRKVDSIRAVVCITSDKCYENREWVWPYRENDPLGGHDPYSSSKAAAELVISAYRRSFAKRPVIASVRAGNVIGGGDWALDRLVPDIVRALLTGEKVEIRNPDSIRPWQHVLEALSGYLLIAERILSGDSRVGTAFNFGPAEDDTRPVSWIVEQMLKLWGDAPGMTICEAEQPHEAALLRLDCSKARAELGWEPRVGLSQALESVVEWHRHVADGGDARQISVRQIRRYMGWN
jgi:CDP-glucose 4,6-dehydratase